MEAHNPAYVIPVVRTMRLWDCAVALSLDRLDPETGDIVPDGYAYPDPSDPYSHIRMRIAHAADQSRPLPMPRRVDERAMFLASRFAQSSR